METAKVNLIRSARWLKGITSDAELARRLGVHPVYFSGILCGRRESRALMIRMAKLLDIPESELLDGSQSQEAPCQTHHVSPSAPTATPTTSSSRGSM